MSCCAHLIKALGAVRAGRPRVGRGVCAQMTRGGRRMQQHLLPSLPPADAPLSPNPTLPPFTIHCSKPTCSGRSRRTPTCATPLARSAPTGQRCWGCRPTCDVTVVSPPRYRSVTGVTHASTRDPAVPLSAYRTEILGLWPDLRHHHGIDLRGSFAASAPCGQPWGPPNKRPLRNQGWAQLRHWEAEGQATAERDSCGRNLSTWHHRRTKDRACPITDQGPPPPPPPRARLRLQSAATTHPRRCAQHWRPCQCATHRGAPGASPK